MIYIDKEKCILCGACIKACPAYIFSQDSGNITTSDVDSCISCGHCSAICPKDAITHRDFNKEKVHSISKPNIDSAELLKMIKLRRSNRTFSDKPIPQEAIDMIIEAAFRAPTASNMQELKFLFIQDEELLEKIIDTTIEQFRGLLKIVDNPIVRPIAMRLSPSVARYLKSFKRIIAERAKGNDPILRGGKALLIIYTDKTVRFGREDANLAYQNGSLMAESLGVAQVYTGFVCNVARRNNKINRLLGITGEIHAGMAIGVPKYTFTKYIDKKDISLRVL